MKWDIIPLALCAALLAFTHWKVSENERIASFALLAVDLPLIILAVHGGSYFDVFAHGHGYWTANRLLNFAVLCGACIVPPIARALWLQIDWHWLGGRERHWRDAHKKGWITTEILNRRLSR